MSFFPILSETKEQKREKKKSAKGFQVGVHFHPGHSQADT